MLLNKNTLQLVSSLRQINESVIFTYPITGMKDTTTGTLVFINMRTLENENFEPFAISKIKEFIDLVKIVGEDPEISIDDNGILSIIGKEGFSSKYITSDVGIMESIAGVKLSTLEAITSKEVIAEFVLTQSECEKARKASDLLVLEDMNFTLQESKNNIAIKCCSKSETNKDFTFNIAEVLSCKLDIKFSLTMSSLKKIPLSDFKCYVRKNEKDDSILALQLIPKECSYITFIIPCEVI